MKFKRFAIEAREALREMVIRPYEEVKQQKVIYTLNRF